MGLQHERDRLIIDRLQEQLDIARSAIDEQTKAVLESKNKLHDMEQYAAELQIDLEQADRRISAMHDRVTAAERLNHELQRKLAEMNK